MRVLVTGGSGFIGSHVVDALVDAGHTPRIFDLRPSPHHPPDEVDTAVGDLLEGDDLREAMADCDAVIHLAAAADVGIVAEEPESSEKINARGTMRVLEAARETGARVIYGSTIWVYGESGEGTIDEESPVGLPAHLYTASKLAGEMYCTSYAELYDVPSTILRFGIPYGPRARPAAVIPTFVGKALAGEPLTIAGDGAQTRRFVYVEDLADGVVRALDRGEPNRIYNLASTETVTIRELAETVRGETRDIELVHTSGRNGDFGGAEIVSHRAEQELGWSAKTPLREGVRRYVEWLGAETIEEEAPAQNGASERTPAIAAAAVPVAVGAGALDEREAEAPERRRRRKRLLELTVGDTRVAALACAIGTLVPYLAAHRLDEFDTPQVHEVGLTTLAASLICVTLLQSASSWRSFRGGLVTAGWLISFYWALLVIPWPHDRLDLAVPDGHTLVFSAVGTVLALAGAATFNLLRAGWASDRVT